MQSRKVNNKAKHMRSDSEPRSESNTEREYCPACRTIFVPGRGCWCSTPNNEHPRPLRPAA